MLKRIPAVNARSQSDLPVLKPYGSPVIIGSDPIGFSRWLGSLPIWLLPLLALFTVSWPVLVSANSGYSMTDAWQALIRWLPFLVGSGFLFNVLISLVTMIIGTMAGVLLGLAQLSPVSAIRWPAKFIMQAFRNSPWLVLLFIVLLALPYEIVIGNTIISIPDWLKAVFGLSLPIMSNIAEIVRGAVQSVPTGQWEAAESLAYTRRQTLWQIILPQCFKRMIPPWMNWYAILTMATPLCSLLGVEELITLSRQAIEAENNKPELLVPFYSFALFIFFAYCYPIARATLALERRYAVKL